MQTKKLPGNFQVLGVTNFTSSSNKTQCSIYSTFKKIFKEKHASLHAVFLPEFRHILLAFPLLSGSAAWTPHAEPPRRNASGRRAQRPASGQGSCASLQSLECPDSWKDRVGSPKNHNTLFSPLGKREIGLYTHAPFVALTLSKTSM